MRCYTSDTGCLIHFWICQEKIFQRKDTSTIPTSSRQCSTLKTRVINLCQGWQQQDLEKMAFNHVCFQENGG